MDKVLYSEKKLAAKMGVAREDLKRIRTSALALEEDLDFTAHNRLFVYTTVGLSKLRAYLEKNSPAFLPDDFSDCVVPQESLGKKNGAAAPEELAIVELTVLRALRNRHLLDAQHPDGHQVRVWVTRNDNFVPRMTVRATPRGLPGYFSLVGRPPRRKGRW